MEEPFKESGLALYHWSPIADELKTKSGYLKDDFVVDDSEGLGSSNGSDDEASWEDATSELEYDEYSYSDED